MNGTIHEASIIGVKDDHGVVILNIGTLSEPKLACRLGCSEKIGQLEIQLSSM